jgi:hypothetical protein
MAYLSEGELDPEWLFSHSVKLKFPKSFQTSRKKEIILEAERLLGCLFPPVTAAIAKSSARCLRAWKRACGHENALLLCDPASFGP